ncbi:transcriptional regulator [Providencia burhodogranariea]|uniref:Two-component response regulator n=1 Tax=Providencia burhodogranariea DSM 19968 TaxID=1141662 RepID=K8WVB4_9GAMM|nr:transcriptional regulator [Providencia burhodogranariea]EKT64604.1 two-component response regulator [Providencia burhodogranariea DSM 19968]
MNIKKEINDESELSDFDLFLDALSGTKLKKEMRKLGKSKKITLTELQSIYNLAVKLYSAMQLKEAEMVFLAYSVLSPYDHRGPGGLASIYLEKKDYKKALDILNTVKTYPTCHMDEVFLDISLCHYKLNEYVDASLVFIIVKQENLNQFYSSRYQFLEQQLKPFF